MSVTSFLQVFSPHVGALAAALCVALGVGLLVVFTANFHGELTMDHPDSVQTAHHHPTPRVGGLGIYLGLVVAWFLLPESEAQGVLGVILVAGLPAWLFGLAEDVTKRVSVLARLLATMFSGALACMISGVALTRLDIPFVDQLLVWWPLAVTFTAFAVGGVANAINIIDGFHGLASGTSILAFLALAILAQLAGDASLALVSLAVGAAVAGFWFVNYPWGKIFLGDGGAYFIGFSLAWLCVLLPMRNPGISPWASLMVCGYPFIEVIYSMLRRFAQRKSLGSPDSKHFHSLLASQVIRTNLTFLPATLQNASVAPFMWAFVGAIVWLAVHFRQSTPALMVSLAGVAVIYHLGYRFLARRDLEQYAPSTATPNSNP